MAVEITMPKLGLSMKEGIVAKWLVQEGEAVKKGAPLVEVMTDKITSQVEAPCDGVLLKVVAAKKTKLPIGGLMGFIGMPGEAVTELAPPVKPGGAAVAESAGKIKISPAAKKLADENNIDVTKMTGSGPEGRITKEDIQQAIENAAAAAPADERAVSTVIPYEGMRRVIGDNMANSWHTAPKVTQHVSVDVAMLQAFRTSLNSGLKDSEKFSLTDLLVKIVSKALELHPKINITLVGEEIRVLKEINIGVAVALDDGLVVPVIKNANIKSLSEISSQIKDLAKRARRNKVNPDEMTGGTFTVTNLGSYGSVDAFTPIINQPESAILGVGRIVKRPVVIDDQIAIRPVIGLSFAFDHRIIDGAPAAAFLATIINLIEHPYKVFV